MKAKIIEYAVLSLILRLSKLKWGLNYVFSQSIELNKWISRITMIFDQFMSRLSKFEWVLN